MSMVAIMETVHIKNPELADLLRRVADGERITIEVDGLKAVLVDEETVDLVERVEDAIDVDALEKAPREPGKPLAQVARELGLTE